MRFAAVWNRIRQQIVEYNVFLTEEQIRMLKNNEDKRNNINCNSQLLREQRIATRIYILLLTICSSILITFTSVSWHTKYLTIYKPSLQIFKQLEQKYSETLNCPCSTNSIAYESFITSQTSMHQICSSQFVTSQWIDSLFILNSSRYSAIDFRTTASAQFYTLRTLCLFAQNYISDSLYNLKNEQLSTSNILSASDITIRINITNERILTDTVTRFNNTLNMIELSTHYNHLISSLNTNFIFGIFRFKNTTLFGYNLSDTAWYRKKQNQSEKCSCEVDSCSLPIGFYSFADKNNHKIHRDLNFVEYNATDMVPGFMGSCTPLQAILKAKLICLYDLKCIEKITSYFPRFNIIISNVQPLNESIPSKYQKDVNVNDLAAKLFLEQWIVSVDYAKYYDKCAPAICKYSYTRRGDFAYMITMLISLHGGVKTLLRIIIPYVITFIFKRRSNRRTNVFTIETNKISVKKRIKLLLKILQSQLIQLNLFKSTDRSPRTIYYQRLSSRLYICLLFATVTILLLFAIINEQATTLTFHRPSYDLYQELYIKYSNKLVCSCTEISPNYESFINITPIYHPICHSDFLKPIWLNQLRLTKNVGVRMADWRIMAFGRFQTLSALCKLVLNTIENELEIFRQRTLFTTHLFNQFLFDAHMNESFNELILTMKVESEYVNSITRLLFQVDQYFSGSNFNGELNISYLSKLERYQISFVFNRPTYYQYPDSVCICTFHSYCQEPMQIFHAQQRIIVPGFVWRCSEIESILFSTLECFFSTTDCLNKTLLYYINITSTAVPVKPLDASELIRTKSNSTIVELVENLFVEEWNISLSHSKYYQACSPILCQYTYNKRANMIYITTIFLGIYGGLTLSLRLLSPLMIKLVFFMKNKILFGEHKHNTVESNMNARHLLKRLYQQIKMKIISINLFEMYVFHESINKRSQSKLVRRASKLYLLLYIIALIILAFYTSFEQRILTEKIYNPKLTMIEDLHKKYGDKLECPCTRASIPHEEFVSVHIDFHQICTSIFIDNRWYDMLFTDIRNMSYFASNYDYRPLLSAHLQFLKGLCTIAMNHVNNTKESFLSRSFITSRLLARNVFNEQLANLLHQTENNLPKVFIRILELTRTINSGNSLVSLYGSNYKYVAFSNEHYASTLLYALPTMYSNSTNCSCKLQSTCLVKAAFHLPRYVEIKGLLVGCVPSASFLASTLECFYDRDCISLIQHHMSSDIKQTSTKPLDTDRTIHSKYKINSTVNDLVENLFMEKWMTNISYDRYFAQCTPYHCTYSYIDNANPFYVVTTLLGLYGGLTVILGWWCPKTVETIQRLQNYHKRKRQIHVTTDAP